jgi:hypothetical protein
MNSGTASKPPLARSRPREVAARCVVFALCAALIPRFWCGRNADALFDGDTNAQEALSDGVVEAMKRRPGKTLYQSGRARFDGQSGSRHTR